ncbi:MAG: transporter [Nitrospirae bacterium]|nr:transporter [Nitrospirota bacterium]
MQKKLTVICCFLFVLISSRAMAHHPTGGAGTGQAGPVKTIPASPAGKGRLAIALQTEFINFDAFSDYELRGHAKKGNDVHSADSIFHSVLGISYGLTDDLTLSLQIPYAHLDNIREAHHDEPEEIHIHGDAKGLGDITLLGHYRFVSLKESNFESAVQFGIKMPSGTTSDKDIDGEQFETEFQPGTGSWNPVIGIAATKRYGQVSLDANLLYTISTKGAQETDLGDVFLYNMSLSYRVAGRPVSWDLIAEVNGEWKQKQEINGVKDENSGEHVLFLSPGIRVSLNRQFSAFLSVGFPVIQDMNGIQNETGTRTLLGIGVTF